MGDHGLVLDGQASNDILEQTIKALDAREGCNLVGTVIINKVPGNFHVSTHAYGDVVQRLYMGGRALDFSHEIKHLSFGNDKMVREI
jgi:Endoplasmic reticulum vesicle transporter